MQIAILLFFINFNQMFKKRENVAAVEEGKLLSPKFDNNGLIPAVTTDSSNGEVLYARLYELGCFKKTIES